MPSVLGPKRKTPEKLVFFFAVPNQESESPGFIRHYFGRKSPNIRKNAEVLDVRFGEKLIY